MTVWNEPNAPTICGPGDAVYVGPSLADLTVAPPAPSRADWNDEGVVIERRFFDESDPRLSNYEALWERLHGFPTRYDEHGRSYRDELSDLEWMARLAGTTATFNPPTREEFGARPQPLGWADCTPYMRHEELRAILCDGDLAELLYGLVGEPCAVHLNLTGWVSTERNWHADTYLNPPEVGDYYAAVWIALDTIDPDSGPFEYVPGSHRWPYVTREKIAPYVDLHDPMWPKHTEQILTPLFEAEIARRQDEAIETGAADAYGPDDEVAPVVTPFLGERGDVLVWHGRLLHRGSPPRVRHLERRGLIAHFSGIEHRSDMPRATRSAKYGGWYFPIENGGRAR